jgi:hypothetical protein
MIREPGHDRAERERNFANPNPTNPYKIAFSNGTRAARKSCVMEPALSAAIKPKEGGHKIKATSVRSYPNAWVFWYHENDRIAVATTKPMMAKTAPSL